MLTKPAMSMQQPRDLGDGLILRWSNAEDTADLAYLVGMVFRDGPDEPPNAPLGQLVNELMQGEHPLMDASGFALVEDTNKRERRIVAATCLWRQSWEYEGIPFSVGRPELVATDPAYRNRGLVRAIFELLHARSEAEGDSVQAITGIPYFYRQFGYEYALKLDGGAFIHTALIPPAREGEPESCTLRDATASDLPLVQELYDRQRAASIVSTLIDERWWRYQLANWQTSLSGECWHIQIITNPAGTALGMLILPMMRRQRRIPIWELTMASGVNLQTLMPALLRAIFAQGPQMQTRSGDQEIDKILFFLNSDHPAYDVLSKLLPLVREPSYSWYIRVPDLPGFIRRIAPVLERRLLDSPVADYTGELKLDFYRGGLRMAFERGRLTVVESWQSPTWDANPDAGFPPLVFSQLLFGHRSLDDLRYAFPDVYAEDRAELLLKALFPTKVSWAIPLG